MKKSLEMLDGRQVVIEIKESKGPFTGDLIRTVVFTIDDAVHVLPAQDAVLLGNNLVKMAYTSSLQKSHRSR